MHLAPAFNIDDRWDTIDQFCRTLDVIWRLDSNASWTLDLSGCDYLGPDAATLIATTFLFARQQGHRCDVKLPTAPSKLAAFCLFSGLEQLLAGGRRPQPDHPSSETVPLCQFYEAMGNAGLPLVSLVQRHRGELPVETETYLHAAYQEVVQNISDHAESIIGGVSCARYFSSSQEIRVAVVDRGIGIHTALARSFPSFSEEEAIRRVLQGGYTSRSFSRNMGQGISNLAQIVSNHYGELVVYSGGAVGITRERGAEPDIRRPSISFPGTAIFFKMKMPG